ncbi:tol-pal system protein YbgF [Thiofaba sp. EF100]|uniref:tol-pal system protein YbgF n=1 Tax=Thiofaba sp. EF100 TaxID=3121274 RepID=UPI0032214A06
MKTTPTILFASMLAAVAAPLHAAQPEWRSWGGGDPAVAPRSADGAAQAAAPTATPSQTIINELMQRQQQLQVEVRELRDLVERQGYEIEQLRKANKDSYADTDRRLRALEQPPAPVPPQAEAPAAPVPPVVPPASAAPAPAPAGNEQAAYDQAFALLKEGKYEQAIKAFDAFVKAHPSSPQVPNAQYWSGEARYVQGDLKGAMQQFELVVKGAPAHPKVPDALLKIGYLFYDQKNYAKARETLNKVKEQFPGSQAANLADQRLKRMQQEGV